MSTTTSNHYLKRSSDDFIDDEYDDEAYLDEEYFEEAEDDEYAQILADYRRKKLIESLIGPVISTLFHIGLIITLAIFIKDRYEALATEIAVTMEEVEEIEIEEPPIEEPDPELEETEVTDPVVTTVAVENVETDDAALEDTNDDTPSTDDNMSEVMVSDIVVSPSAFASPSVYGGRSAAGRASSVSKFGGSKAGQNALLKALWWLAKVQNPDGSWGQAQKEAMTGLAVLTFLAHGETSSSKHFGKNVRKGVQWLCKQVENNNGVLGRNNNGGGGNTGRSVYSHALVAYALSEATAMMGISTIEEAMNKAIRVVIDGQMANGGFFYNYQKGGPANLSNASFNYQALKAAYTAGSEEEGLQEAIHKSISHLKATAKEDSFYYRSDMKDPRGPSMRCVGTLCLQLLGEPDCAEARRIGDYIEKNDMQYLVWQGESGRAFNAPLAFPLYFWYYGTQVMFQRGGKGWRTWNKKYEKLLLDNQFKDGHWETPSAIEGDRFNMSGIDKQVYSTTLCGLMLTVYYRYLPSSKSLGAKTKTEKKAIKEEEEEELNLIE